MKNKIKENTSTEDIVLDLSKTYKVTPDGKVINIKKNYVVSFCLDHKGYPKARLWCPSISKHKDKRVPFRLHKVIAMFFLKDYAFSFLLCSYRNGI